MRRIVIGLLAALCATSAWGQSLNLNSAARVPEKIISLGAAHVVSMRVANCTVVPPAITQQCETAVTAYAAPIVLREVQLHPVPAAIADTNGQCWARVFVSEDRVAFEEIAKFTWRIGDYRGFNHVLAMPIALRPSELAVVRIVVGSITPTGDALPCGAEAKIYNTAL
jgi:hypothetical protein